MLHNLQTLIENTHITNYNILFSSTLYAVSVLTKLSKLVNRKFVIFSSWAGKKYKATKICIGGKNQRAK